MAQMGLFRCHKQTSSATSGGQGGGATSTTAGGHHCRSNYGFSRLMRKLRKQSRLLCMATRPTTFHSCQYDPLSYARNFDCNGFGAAALDDDSAYFHYTFSSRFAATPSGISRPLATNH